MTALTNKFFTEYKTNTGTFKLIEVKNGPIIILPLNANIGGQSTSYRSKYDGNNI